MGFLYFICGFSVVWVLVVVWAAYFREFIEGQDEEDLIFKPCDDPCEICDEMVTSVRLDFMGMHSKGGDDE